jgi:hypothetical protein
MLFQAGLAFTLGISLLSSAYFAWQHGLACFGVTTEFFIVIGVLIPVFVLSTFTVVFFGIAKEATCWKGMAVIIALVSLGIEGLFWWAFNYGTLLYLNISFIVFLLAYVKAIQQEQPIGMRTTSDS